MSGLKFIFLPHNLFELKKIYSGTLQYKLQQKYGTPANDILDTYHLKTLCFYYFIIPSPLCGIIPL